MHSFQGKKGKETLVNRANEGASATTKTAKSRKRISFIKNRGTLADLSAETYLITVNLDESFTLVRGRQHAHLRMVNYLMNETHTSRGRLDIYSRQARRRASTSTGLDLITNYLLNETYIAQGLSLIHI